MILPELAAIEEAARAVLEDAFSAREAAIGNGRIIIRRSANAIRNLHRGEAGRARELLAEAGEMLAESTAAVAGRPDINPGILHDAAKEYAEASLFAAVACGEELPGAEELGVFTSAYLNGLGEAVGEVRRRMLDKLRADETAEAERLLSVMDEVVDLLAALDYPDGMTGGLRRTADAARGMAERSRADLTAAVTAERLRRDLAGAGDGRFRRPGLGGAESGVR